MEIFVCIERMEVFFLRFFYYLFDLYCACMCATPTHKLLQVWKQVVTNLFTRHKLSASCVRTACSMLLQQVWYKLLTVCNKLDDIIRLVTRLFQQF